MFFFCIYIYMYMYMYTVNVHVCSMYSILGTIFISTRFTALFWLQSWSTCFKASEPILKHYCPYSSQTLSFIFSTETHGLLTPLLLHHLFEIYYIPQWPALHNCGPSSYRTCMCVCVCLQQKLIIV